MKSVNDLMREGLIREHIDRLRQAAAKIQQEYEARQYRLWQTGFKGIQAWSDARH